MRHPTGSDVDSIVQRRWVGIEYRISVGEREGVPRHSDISVKVWHETRGRTTAHSSRGYYRRGLLGSELSVQDRDTKMSLIVPSKTSMVTEVEILKSGWMHKQGGARGGRKNWYTTYYFVIDPCVDALVISSVWTAYCPIGRLDLCCRKHRWFVLKDDCLYYYKDDRVRTAASPWVHIAAIFFPDLVHLLHCCASHHA